MSIARAPAKNPKVCRTLIGFDMPRGFFIKDLKDLENGTGTFFYRHVGPKGPKTPLLTMAIAGETRSDARMASEGPRATVKNGELPVGETSRSRCFYRDKDVPPTQNDAHP